MRFRHSIYGLQRRTGRAGALGGRQGVGRNCWLLARPQPKDHRRRANLYLARQRLTRAGHFQFRQICQRQLQQSHGRQRHPATCRVGPIDRYQCDLGGFSRCNTAQHSIMRLKNRMSLYASRGRLKCQSEQGSQWQSADNSTSISLFFHLIRFGARYFSIRLLIMLTSIITFFVRARYCWFCIWGLASGFGSLAVFWTVCLARVVSSVRIY